MGLTQKDVEHIARLARIRLTQEEKKLYAKQLTSILEYVAQLQELDTEGVFETAQAISLENVMREDVSVGCEHETKKRIRENFPEREDDLLKTKSVF